MCRMAGYVGVPRTLDVLLYEAEHALQEQAYAPREQLHGTVNVDGTGVAWWPEGAREPLRYATTLPPWSDENLLTLAPSLRTRSMLAAVRGATPGIGGGRAAVAPFVLSGLAIAHNGWLGGFREHVAPRLVADLPARWVGALDVLSDSLLIALHVAARHDPARPLTDTVEEAVRYVASVCDDAGQPATLNLLVADGRRLVASRASTNGPSNSLYVLADGGPPWNEAGLIASEPLDRGPWQPVAEGHVVEVAPDSWRTRPLHLDNVP